MVQLQVKFAEMSCGNTSEACQLVGNECATEKSTDPEAVGRSTGKSAMKDDAGLRVDDAVPGSF